MKRASKIVFFVAGGMLLAVAFSVVKPVTVRAAKVAAMLIRDEDNPARHPFQATCSTTETNICVVTTVPAGQELVIQGATFKAFINPGPGSSVEAVIVTTANATIVGHSVGMQDLGPAVGVLDQPHEYIAVLPITLYADPGTNVQMYFNRGFVIPETISFTATISGYTVSLP
jgi:hypothetical protein